MQLTWQQILLTVVASLLSGLLGVGISTWYYRRHERRRVKLDTVTRLFGYRFDILGADFSRALNEIYVVFNESPEVLRALQEFHQVIVTRQGELANDKLVTLLKALWKDVGINPATANDSFHLQPFNPTERSRDTMGKAGAGLWRPNQAMQGTAHIRGLPSRR